MSDLKTQLDQVLAILTKHYEEGAIKEAMQQCYARDCKVMGPGYEKALEGTDNEDLLKKWEERKQSGAEIFKIHRDEILDLGDFAVERSHYDFTKADSTTVTTGHVLNLWKKEDGNWKLYHVIYTA